MLVLQLDNRLLENYLELMDNASIENTPAIYEALEVFHRMMKLSSDLDTINIELESILEWVDNTILETFDYRNDSFDEDVVTLSETMSDLPDSLLFDPIFKLLEKSQMYVEENVKLFNEHEINDMVNSSQIDTIFNILGVIGCIETAEIENYKTSLESDLYRLTDKMFKGTLGANNHSIVEERLFTISSKNDLDYSSFDIYLDPFTLIGQLYDNLLSDELSSDIPLDYIELLSFEDEDGCSVNGLSPEDFRKYQGEFGVFTTYAKIVSGMIYDTIYDSYLHLSTSEFLNTVDKLIEYLAKYPCGLTRAEIRLLTIIYVLVDSPMREKVINKTNHIINDEFRTNSNAFNLFVLYNNKLKGIFYDGKNLDMCKRDYWNENYNSTHNGRPVISIESLIPDATVYGSNENLTHSMNALAEMFEVRRDGSIKVELKDRTTFMNEYALNHRLLKLNYKQGDYEAMKYNLVYHMILIENIEKNVLYNKKVKKSSKIYKDAEKARRFALNDVSTYLPIVKSNDPSFNLNEFYKQVKADRNTIEINAPDTISGVKKILNSILL